jgi:hypothetical protein
MFRRAAALRPQAHVTVVVRFARPANVHGSIAIGHRTSQLVCSRQARSLSAASSAPRAQAAAASPKRADAQASLLSVVKASFSNKPGARGCADRGRADIPCCAVLRARSPPVDIATISSPAVREIIQRLTDVITKDDDAGMAAPQLGVSQRLFVMVRALHIAILSLLVAIPAP